VEFCIELALGGNIHAKMNASKKQDINGWNVNQYSISGNELKSMPIRGIFLCMQNVFPVKVGGLGFEYLNSV